MKTDTPVAAAPLASNYTVVWHNADDEYYVEGSGLAKLGEGRFIAVVPVVPRREWSEERRIGHSQTHILHSDDNGNSWRKVSELPYYSACPWVHQGVLYLFANKGGSKYRNDDLLLLCSSNGGVTWSDPVTLFQGHFWNCHTGMVVHRNRFYWAIDDLALGSKRGPQVVCCDLSGDPMNPNNWRISNSVPFSGVPEAMTNVKYAGHKSQYLEPNVILVGDRLRVLSTVKALRQTSASVCAVFDVEDNGDRLELKFAQYSSMPGGQLKFSVIWDDVSKMFWATANLVVDSQGILDCWQEGVQRGNYVCASKCGGDDRRFLMLLYGLDGLNWFQAGCIAQAAKISQSFMYARPVIDGEDLAIISRSSINAPNQHDADCATFHRVRDFRRLALNLFPEPEE